MLNHAYPAVRQHVEQGPHVGAAAAFVESSAVNQNRRWEGTCAVRNVQVYQQRLASRTAKLHVFLIHGRG